MRAHPKELGVQMAATACLYNLSKGEMGQKIHPLWLAKLVDLTLDAMQNFPNHQQVSSPTYVFFLVMCENFVYLLTLYLSLQLQKNALLTLCSDRILQDVVIFNVF